MPAMTSEEREAYSDLLFSMRPGPDVTGKAGSL